MFSLSPALLYCWEMSSGSWQWRFFLVPDGVSIAALARVPGEAHAAGHGGDGAAVLGEEMELEWGEDRQMVSRKWSVAHC